MYPLIKMLLHKILQGVDAQLPKVLDNVLYGKDIVTIGMVW